MRIPSDRRESRDLSSRPARMRIPSDRGESKDLSSPPAKARCLDSRGVAVLYCLRSRQAGHSWGMTPATLPQLCPTLLLRQEARPDASAPAVTLGDASP